MPGYEPLDPAYAFLFNSYYNGVGPQFSRPARGHLSRPTVADVFAYRAWVDRGMERLLASMDAERAGALAALVELGLNHEQQHQELILTDIKYNLAVNPLHPAYHAIAVPRGTATAPLDWRELRGGLVPIGYDGAGFAFDNEGPRHTVYLRPFRLADRLTTNGEYLEFIDAGGYRTPGPWLSEGWRAVQERGWQAPLYWERQDELMVDADAEWLPACRSPRPGHPRELLRGRCLRAVARTHGCRPSRSGSTPPRALPIEGISRSAGSFIPCRRTSDEPLAQLFGDVWEWTQSAYAPYPGYRAEPGAVGEYNGKFMVSQLVLRGGSCVTPASHIRASYRNFFPPDARWQFSGIRLAEDA